MTTPMKTTTNNEKAREPIDDDATTNLIFSNRVCCFCFPCFGRSDRSTPGVGSRSEWWEGARTAEIEERWWRKGWTTVMKAREWSEIVAGPKWKTFIRRFRKRGGGRGQGKFQYDPLSYAMNFDEGQWQNGDSEAEHGGRDFSTRFVSAKSTVVISETSPPLLTAAVDS
ncbi:hypothetical protein AAC387_Pa07g2224 [Persea americana]